MIAVSHPTFHRHPDAPPRARRATPAAGVHARRRLVAALGVVLAAGLGLGLAGELGPGVSTGPVSVATSVHVVQPGDSLWRVAVAHAPEGTADIRPWVDALAAANPGASAGLDVGDRISIPW